MPAKTEASPSPPTGLARLLFRLPIWFYRLGLGWLMGKRFLLLNHTGRKSGLPRQTVLEVVDYDQASQTYSVASGWGRKSDWYQNILKTPNVTIQVGRGRHEVVAVPLSPQESGEAMVDYARRHPRAARNLARLIGHHIDGTAAAYHRLGAESIPFVRLRPR